MTSLAQSTAANKRSELLQSKKGLAFVFDEHLGKAGLCLHNGTCKES